MPTSLSPVDCKVIATLGWVTIGLLSLLRICSNNFWMFSTEDTSSLSPFLTLPTSVVAVIDLASATWEASMDWGTRSDKSTLIGSGSFPT